MSASKASHMALNEVLHGKVIWSDIKDNVQVGVCRVYSSDAVMLITTWTDNKPNTKANYIFVFLDEEAQTHLFDSDQSRATFKTYRTLLDQAIARAKGG